MKRLARAGTIGFALANLYLLFLTEPLVSPQRQLIFHLRGPGSALFVPVLLDLLLLSAVFTALLAWTEQQGRAELITWAILLLPVPWAFVETIATFTGRSPADWLLWPAILIATVGVLLCVFASRALLPLFLRIRPFAATVLRFIAFSSAVLVLQLLWYAWKARGPEQPFTAHRPVLAPTAQPRPRVIWVVLDELSYRQLYGHRLPGLALPNFDRLAAQSTVFTQASPVAAFTRAALPGLLTGRAVNETSSTADGGHLRLHERGRSGWPIMDEQDTVFADAKRLQLPTAVAGWYEPYCRMLPSVLDQCFWTFSDTIPGDMSPEDSMVQNAMQPLRLVALGILHTFGLRQDIGSPAEQDVQRHRQDFRDLVSEGDRMLQSQTSGLLLLHMPIPHPWGFYDRHTRSFPSYRTSYVDNLALADDYLGHVRSLLEQQGAWDTTDLVIMGDHGWRPEEVWRDSGFWTADDEAASQGTGRNDPPAVVVKLNGQHTPSRIAASFDAVRTRALLDALLRGQIQTPEQLDHWTEQGSSH